MATITYLVGEPGFQWYNLLANVLQNGAFTASGTGLSTVTLSAGSISLVLNGSGIATNGARSISAGSITSFALISNGTTVVQANGFQNSVPASGIQQVIDSFAGGPPGSPDLALQPIFSEPLTINGSSARDQLFGSTFNDVINGGDGTDSINAAGGDDQVNAGAGDDFIQGSAGRDTVNGAVGYDTLGFHGLGGSISVEMDTNGTAGGGTVTGAIGSGSAVNARFFNLERVVGTQNADSFVVADGYVGTDEGDRSFGGDRGGPKAMWVGGGGNDVFTDNSGQAGGLVTVNYDAEKFEHDGDGVWGNGPGEFGVIINTSANAITADVGYGSTLVAAATARDTFGGTDTLNRIQAFRATDAADYAIAGDDGIYVDGRGGNDTLIGGAGRDRLRGGNGNDSITGGDGGDELQGGSGDDTIGGGEGDDSIDGDDGNDTLTGGAGNDYLNGGRGNDTITAGAGSYDSIQGSSGTDTVDGGDGVDDLRFRFEAENNEDDPDDHSADVVTVTLTGANGAGSVTGSYGGTAISTTFTALEGASGTAGADTFSVQAGFGNTGFARRVSGPDRFFSWVGGDGADTFTDGFGRVVVDYDEERWDHESFRETGGRWGDNGEAGVQVNASSTSRTGTTLVAANRAIDTFGALDVLSGITAFRLTDAADYIWASNTGTRIDARHGDDTIFGGGGNDVIRGDDGADIINGGLGSDDISGGRDNDTINGEDGDDFLFGDDGNDVVSGGSGHDEIGGSSGNDTLHGDAGNDRIYGDDGNDIINGGLGDDDDLSGGSGNDTVNGDDGSDYINGDDGDDVLNGGAGSDELYGGDGNDTLDGGASGDRMEGNVGNDIYLVDSTADRIWEDDGNGFDIVNATASFSLKTAGAVENLTLLGSADLFGSGNGLNNVLNGNNGNNVLSGGQGNDSIVGGLGNDILSGGQGNDTLSGGQGNDLLDGNAGDDGLTGGQGDDTYVIDSNGDVLNELAGGGVDTVRSSITYTMIAEFENLVFTGTGDINAVGNAVANVIAGNDGANNIGGGQGQDTITGGGGDDVIGGGQGADTLGGGLGNDTISGGLGNDTVLGGAGSDILNGNAGTDTLSGGADGDRFVFSLASETGIGAGIRDIITDFAIGADRIDLTGMDANANTGSDDAFSFINGAAFSNVAGQLRASSSGGVTVVEGDTNGDGIADFQIQLNGTLTLSGGDFVL